MQHDGVPTLWIALLWYLLHFALLSFLSQTEPFSHTHLTSFLTITNNIIFQVCPTQWPTVFLDSSRLPMTSWLHNPGNNPQTLPKQRTSSVGYAAASLAGSALSSFILNPRYRAFSCWPTTFGPRWSKKYWTIWSHMDAPTPPTGAFVTTLQESMTNLTRHASTARRLASPLPELWSSPSVQLTSRKRPFSCGSTNFSPSTTRTFFMKGSSRSCVTGSVNQATLSPYTTIPCLPFRPLIYFVGALLLLSLIQFDSKRGRLLVYLYLFASTSLKWISKEFQDVFYYSSFLMFICFQSYFAMTYSTLPYGQWGVAVPHQVFLKFLSKQYRVSAAGCSLP